MKKRTEACRHSITPLSRGKARQYRDANNDVAAATNSRDRLAGVGGLRAGKGAVREKADIRAQG